MLADIGYLTLVLTLVLMIYAIAGNIIYLKTKNERIFNSARGAVYAVAFLATVAALVLIYLLTTGDFSVTYVAEYTSSDLPFFYKITALWAGNAGSLLLWFWVLSIYAAMVARGNKIKDMTPHVLIILMINALFFGFVMSFLTNPFERLPYNPGEGQGLNPMLQNPGMVIHPVTTYLGYVGFAIPFAFAMAGLMLKRSDDEWIKTTRGWTIIAWLFLTLGNLTGAQWAYEELGWGGYWAWDPVENASFLPWLTGSAFLHSVMIQERKNMLKIWNILLIIITFVLTLFGTFLVRSGVLTSVHAFGRSDLGKYFLAFTVAAAVASLWLMADRLQMLREEKEFESYISKESSFLFNNLILVGIAFATFWGTIFPLISEAVTGNKITVSIPFFNSINGPFGLALTLLIGICPLIAWRKSGIKNLVENFLVPGGIALTFAVVSYMMGLHKPYALLAFTIACFSIVATLWDVIKGVAARKRITGENIVVAAVKLIMRNRRRYGGYIIHLGILMLIVGVIGSHAYDSTIVKTLKIGETVKVQDYTLTYQNLAERKQGKNDTVYASLLVSKGNKTIGTLEPERVFYPTHPNPSTEVAIRSTLKEDLYIILSEWDKDGSATFKFLVNPLVAWLWIGGYVMIFGTIFSLWPGRGGTVGAKYIQRS